MSTAAIHSPKILILILKVLSVSAVLLLFSENAFSQNSKGDRTPINNQRKVRETKAKSYKRKEKGNTRDIAGRRLRTKGQSSANRASAQYPQPSPYANRKIGKQSDRAAKPRGRVFTKSPNENRSRVWKGDVSGYALRHAKPSKSEAARENVYPQKGPYSRYVRKQPKNQHRVYSKTIKGTPFVTHRPRPSEKAWTGGLDHGPIRNQSATGTIPNNFTPKGLSKYGNNKRAKGYDKAISNKKQLAQLKKLSNAPGARAKNVQGVPSATRPFIQRGKKNVYWGKYQRKEKGVTGDLTGRPLRTRNFKSMTPGLVSRDTLRYFGRKPSGDRFGRSASGYGTATAKGQRGWKGDVAGWRLRKPGGGKNEVPGKFFFPRKLSISNGMKRNSISGGGYSTRSRKGERAELNSVPGIVYGRSLSSKKMKGVKPIKGGGSVRGGWNNNGQPIPGRASGLGAAGAVRYSGTFRGFSRAGANYQGNIKGRRGLSEQGIGYSGNIKGGPGGYSRQGAGYSGNIKGGQTGFSRQGAGYSGNIRGPRGFSQQGAGYSGNIKGGQIGFSRQGAGYSGNIKGGQTGFSRQGAGYSGNIKGLRGFSQQGAGYSGNIKGGQIGFSRQGAGYSGNIKGGQTGFSRQGAGYSGNIKGGQIGFSRQGAGYSGNIKGQRGFTTQGAGYSGNIKGGQTGFSRQGAGYSGNILGRRGFTPQGAGYSGNIKYRRVAKGGGSASNQPRDNNGQPPMVTVPKSASAGGIQYTGRLPGKKFVQNPNSSSASLKKRVPSARTFDVAGLQIPMRQGKYESKPNASKYALPGIAPNRTTTKASKHAGTTLQTRHYQHNPNSNKYALNGIAPTRATVKASEYSKSMKAYREYKHNPNSNKYAINGIAPGKASARINDYQGNMKMHKYSGSRLHPDAQFAHGYRDNVKGERTVLMNVKLLWGKLFRKNETQPENLKEKTHRPRYDKREKDLWND